MNESAGLDPLSIALLVVATAVVMYACLVGVQIWERRLIWPYVRVEVAERVRGDRLLRVTLRVPLKPGDIQGSLQLSPRAVQAGLDAQARGFEWLGLFRDGRGVLYRMLYEMWLSPDRTVLAIVSSGSLAGIPLEAIRLHSPLAGGRMLVSIDNPAATAGDLSGLLTETFFAAKKLDELVAHHETERSRLGGEVAAPFVGDSLQQLRESGTQAALALERQGYLRFLTVDREAWRYTVSGAMLSAARLLAREFRRQLSPWSYFRRRKRP